MTGAPGVMSVAPHAMPVAPHMANGVSRPVAPQAVAAVRGGVKTGVSHTGARIAPRNTARSRGTRRHFNQGDRILPPGCSTVPGLGFDIPHLAATCGPEAVGAGRHALQSSFFFPFLDGGFMVNGAPAVTEEGAPAEGQTSEDSEAEVREREHRARTLREEPAPAPVSRAETTPPRESSEYVFVRKDGTVFFAVAYAWEKETLRYITNEGLRRSATRDSLDLDATQRFNEQRGLNF